MHVLYYLPFLFFILPQKLIQNDCLCFLQLHLPRAEKERLKWRQHLKSLLKRLGVLSTTMTPSFSWRCKQHSMRTKSRCSPCSVSLWKGHNTIHIHLITRRQYSLQQHNHHQYSLLQCSHHTSTTKGNHHLNTPTAVLLRPLHSTWLHFSLCHLAMRHQTNPFPSCKSCLSLCHSTTLLHTLQILLHPSPPPVRLQHTHHSVDL